MSIVPDLLTFRKETTEGLLPANKSKVINKEQSHARTNKPCIGPSPSPSAATRFDATAHWPIFLKQKNATRCGYSDCKQKKLRLHA